MAALSLCIGRWFFRRRPRRQSTAALGLGRNRRKQGIDFGLIQTLQRSGQVLGQDEIVWFGFALWNSQGLGHPCCRLSRKQVWCCVCRSPRCHEVNYAAAISLRQQAVWRYALPEGLCPEGSSRAACPVWPCDGLAQQAQEAQHDDYFPTCSPSRIA